MRIMQRLSKASSRTIIFFGLSIVAFLSACVEPPRPKDEARMIISTEGRHERSTTASNLMTTALRTELDVDFVIFPSEGLNPDTDAIIEAGMDPAMVERRVSRLFAGGVWDRVVTGSLSGANIRRLLVNRTVEVGRHDLHVDGLRYSVRLEGGLPAVYQVETLDGKPLDDSRIYRVALSLHALQGEFPGYRFRHGLNFGFRYESTASYSAEDVLKRYMQRIENFSLYTSLRSTVEIRDLGEVAGSLSIPEIKGSAFISPYMAKRVTTQGIVTAVGTHERFGLEFYLQSSASDGNDKTSEGILVRLGEPNRKIRVGSSLLVSGTVEEEMTNTGLTRTILTRITGVDVLAEDQPLPSPVILGYGEEELDGRYRTVPNRRISTYRGNLNQKTELNLEDGADFWESVEGMRAILRRPTVVGLSGGRNDASQRRRYLNIFVVANDTASPETLTYVNGLRSDPDSNNYNPEIIKIVDHHFSNSVNPDYIFEVGDQFDYDLEGILAFEASSFGGGEYVFYVTGRFNQTRDKIAELEERPRTTLLAEPGKLTVATYNVQDLTGREQARIREIGRTVTINLGCPDIVNFVEIMDDNGLSFERVQAHDDNRLVFAEENTAESTMNSLIAAIQDCPHPVEYRPLIIDPIRNNEGGIPGGNIRLGMIYNALRVDFEPRGVQGPLEETYPLEDGRLSSNPGRLFPNDPVFRGTRRSLIAEFGFQGETIYIIGNHLNAKVGDTSLWDVNQPAILTSEVRRARMASRINTYMQKLLQKNPNAHIISLGDFNDTETSMPLRVYEGDILRNLKFALDENGQPLVPKDRRYTYIFQGNSQAIDHILASYSLLERSPELEVLNINSNYMGQHADHDPLVSRFDFSIDR